MFSLGVGAAVRWAFKTLNSSSKEIFVGFVLSHSMRTIENALGEMEVLHTPDPYVVTLARTAHGYQVTVHWGLISTIAYAN